MLFFKALDLYTIKDRGKVFIVKNDKTRNHEDFSKEFYNQYVLIDGFKFKCIGIELNAIPTISEGSYIGILVEDFKL